MTVALTIAAVLLLSVLVGLMVVDHCLRPDPDEEGADHA
jgi:hypothetical protein